MISTTTTTSNSSTTVSPSILLKNTFKSPTPIVTYENSNNSEYKKDFEKIVANENPIFNSA